MTAPITLHQFEALDRTHADVVRMLKLLESAVQRLESNGIDDTVRDAAATLCQFFDATARAHHEDEERIVFPPLLGSGDPTLVQHVQRLQQDHGWLEEDWRELRSMLSTIAEGRAWHEPESLHQMVEVFCTLYVEHIALEESLIYPESRHRLAAAETAERKRVGA